MNSFDFQARTETEEFLRSGVPEHLSDADCAPFLVDDSCSVCGVDHSAECSLCHGKGFHYSDCPELA